MIHLGDCIDIMPTLDAESIDAIVTDPPYGLGFMGKDWDSPGAFVQRKARRAAEGFDRVGGNHHPTSAADIGRTRLSEGRKSQAWHEAWAREALRVAKPGAYLLAFGGTRTVHRLTCAIEDAGWIIRDMLVWGYASGFPKSKASLKPAWEPIVMARKPGPLRELTIDACRIGIDGGGTTCPDFPNECRGHGDERSQNGPTVHKRGRQGEASANRRYTASGGPNFAALPGPRGGAPNGRWPANIVLTDPIFDGGIEGVVGGGETASGKMLPTVPNATRTVYGQDAAAGYTTIESYGDSGTYSRFFLIPKADRRDREPVLGGSGGRVVGVWGGDEDDLSPGKKSTIARRNTHPTVKPTNLMRHLVRLVTPTGGIVLDPFLGSGTSALAAEMEGLGWVGIEREEEYVRIAEARLNGVQRGLPLRLPAADSSADIIRPGEHEQITLRAATGDMDVVAPVPLRRSPEYHS